MGYFHGERRAAPMNTQSPKPGFWPRAAVAAGTGILFMVVYHLTNAYAAVSARTGQCYWEWELSLPLVAWLIVPYWSIDLLFVIAPFLCVSREELFALGRRLTLAIIVAGVVFMAWPLTLGFDRQGEYGIFAPLFAAIHGFDKPNNLFPSLHVAFAVILRWTYHRHLGRLGRWIFHVWFALITASTVLVGQHHLIDVAGGLALAVVCCALVPEGAVRTGRHCRDRRAIFLSSGFAAGALICCIPIIIWGGWAWLGVWPGLVLLLLAYGHISGDAGIWGKTARGIGWSTRLLFAPYLMMLQASRWWWWRRDRVAAVAVAPGVWLGRLPRRGEVERLGIHAVLDLTAEHQGPVLAPGVERLHFPLMDVCTPSAGALAEAAQMLEELRQRGPVLVHCALGYGRSAAVVAAWLIRYGGVTSSTEAGERIRACRPLVHLRPAIYNQLDQLLSRPCVRDTLVVHARPF